MARLLKKKEKKINNRFHAGLDSAASRWAQRCRGFLCFFTALNGFVMGYGQVLRCSVVFYKRFNDWNRLGPCGFHRVVPGFTGFYWVLLGFTGFYWVLLGFTGFDWVLLGLTGFNWV